ncbi:hypothetical protein [Actinoplanes sp. CA-252034]|uniref:hypothetical protein n=1 Tax=Actinoplanes sp. CA-252034 TaxID=3239906 RepID=UPI003D96BCE0
MARLLAPLETALREATGRAEDFHLDMEYERHGTAPKGFDRSARLPAKFVPDLIFHRRLTGENILAIEVKLSRRASTWKDEQKLALLTGEMTFAAWSAAGDDVVRLPRNFSPYRYGALLRLDPGLADEPITWFGNDPDSPGPSPGT